MSAAQEFLAPDQGQAHPLLGGLRQTATGGLI